MLWNSVTKAKLGAARGDAQACCRRQVTTGARVALRNDSYTLHLLLPTKVDPLVSLMKVEKVPDSTYDMIGGLDQQIKEIKEVRRRWRPAGAPLPRQPGSPCLFLLAWSASVSSRLGFALPSSPKAMLASAGPGRWEAHGGQTRAVCCCVLDMG